MKKLACLILIIFSCFTLIKKPVFIGGQGVYGVTTGGGSAGKTVLFDTRDISLFYGVKDITGQSLSTDNGFYVNKFLSDYNCVFLFEEAVDGITVKYYYSPKIWAYRSVNGQKVNVECAIKDGFYTIGSPMIYGGF